ncbi:AEC family transporter [Spirochaeta lutea]|uniref:Transporter n=1 Tax=Spirochaeta lutea TaxID=1480694 RepID=A0A098QZS0_9SPIO|nr:AEC family transporter [Spirochaeta lutea]KGE71987.1 hypothetical protein DC28_09395 [Spirochaeta lutea]
MNLLPAVLTILRLFGLVILGYGVFRVRVLQERLLPLLLGVMINLGFPLYSINRISAGWGQALEAGWQWMVWFFAAGAGMIALQFILGRILINRAPLLKTGQPRELLLLFALHNAGYIPLPIIGALVPGPVVVYMFYYVLAFNLLFWTVSVPLLEQSGSGRARFRLRVTPPLVGIILGIIIAAAGWYRFIPEFIEPVFSLAGSYAMDAILFVLGGTLSSIPRESLGDKPELWGLILYKQLLYPGVMLVAAWGLSRVLSEGLGLPDQVSRGIGLALIVEAAVPPATNSMIVTRRYGTQDQLHLAGAGTILTYAVSMVTLPVFIVLGLWVL